MTNENEPAAWRDKVALAVLPTLMEMSHDAVKEGIRNGVMLSPEQIERMHDPKHWAEGAYQIADAMQAVRDGKGT